MAAWCSSPIQHNVLAAADISMLDVALDIRNYQEDGGCVDHEIMVIITKVLDDEVNARLSGSISNSVVFGKNQWRES